MKTFRAVPAQTVCARCENLFVYFRKTRPRRLCDTCIPIVIAESNRETARFLREFWATERQKHDQAAT
jgi:hypothetical protein